jgi:hypothetical protein
MNSKDVMGRGKPLQPQLVKINWIDVHNVTGSWHDPDELKEPELTPKEQLK